LPLYSLVDAFSSLFWQPEKSLHLPGVELVVNRYIIEMKPERQTHNVQNAENRKVVSGGHNGA
jgi:hypothetical protein